ncbi:otoferlin-like [Planococcus citri]|uniref:otoferlin-like n=1 Tax=Planococcus citri TaxID=170843 RepID=UPI0031FA174F
MSLRSSMEAINSIFEVKDAAKPHDFCVHVRIIEGSQFAGINADPVRVCVQIGRNKKYTQEIGNTICPVYKEDFRFNFNDKPAAEFLDEMITLTVLHVKTQMLRMKKTETTIGTYKVNLRTVYDEPDHQFIDKICELRDPHHIGGSCKGTVKCDFRITCQGNNAITPSIPTVITTEYDEVDRISPKSDEERKREKQKVRLIVKIYRADGLPKMTRSVGTYVKENFAGESKKDFVNPYVEVSFAGLEGKTKVIPHNCAPVWNEQIVFHEMFSSLFQRIKIQLKERDNDIVHSNIIGTHFIDLKIISRAGNGGEYRILRNITQDYQRSALLSFICTVRPENLAKVLGIGVGYSWKLKPIFWRLLMMPPQKYKYHARVQ